MQDKLKKHYKFVDNIEQLKQEMSKLDPKVVDGVGANCAVQIDTPLM